MVTVLISSGATGEEWRRRQEESLSSLFRNAGFPVLLIPHLYHITEEDRLRRTLSETGGSIVLLSWLHPRPAEWLLRRYGARAPMLALNLEAYDTPEMCFTTFLQSGFSTPAPDGHRAPAEERRIDFESSGRWYPVIDCGRCVNCQQCLQFCLFGVYALGDDGKVFVKNPDNCKHGCPACSRICPKGAIMFPLHEDAAIAGAPGLFMAPDSSAKAMFYARTKCQCPVCGSAFKPGLTLKSGNENVCGECGRIIEQTGAPSTPADEKEDDSTKCANRGTHDIDTLIEELEKLR